MRWLKGINGVDFIAFLVNLKDEVMEEVLKKEDYEFEDIGDVLEVREDKVNGGFHMGV